MNVSLETQSKIVDPTDLLFALAEEVAPKPKPTRKLTRNELRLLEQRLSSVSDQHVLDKPRFVDAVNRMLIAAGYRICLAGGGMALLAVARLDRGRFEYIRFRVTAGPRRGTWGRLNGDMVKIAKLSESVGNSLGHER